MSRLDIPLGRLSRTARPLLVRSSPLSFAGEDESQRGGVVDRTSVIVRPLAAGLSDKVNRPVSWAIDTVADFRHGGNPTVHMRPRFIHCARRIRAAVDVAAPR